MTGKRFDAVEHGNHIIYRENDENNNLKMNYVNYKCVGDLKANKKCCYAIGIRCTAPKYQYDYCEWIAKGKNDCLKKMDRNDWW